MGDIESILKNNPLNNVSFKGISLLGLIATAVFSVAYITYLVEYGDVGWRSALTHMVLTDVVLWFGLAASSVFYLTDFFRHKMKNSGFIRSDFQGIFYESDLEDISLFGLIICTVFGLIYVVLHIMYTDVVSLFGLALLIVFGLTYSFKLILKSAGISDLQGIVRDSDWYPSLSRVQFLSWTFIIGIAFVWIFLLKAKYAYVNSAEMDLSKLTVPDNLLLLMGITSLTTVVSKGLSSVKYTGKREKQSKHQLPHLGTMFQENERPSITRYQIFLWTSISVLTYFGLVFGAVVNSYNAETSGNILSLTIPDCPQILLFLMGISQATYLGGKFTSQTSEKPGISRIVPEVVKIGDTITIYGLNFGEKRASVLLDKTAVADDYIDTWQNNMIKLKIPENIHKIPDMSYSAKIEVVNGSGNTTDDPYEHEHKILIK